MSGIPGKVFAPMKSDGLSIGGGAPYFVTSLLDHPDCTAEHMAHFKTVGLGGSTVPAAVTRRLADMGIFVFRSYGSTEHPSITGSSFDAPEASGCTPTATSRPGRRGPTRPTTARSSAGDPICASATPTRADRERPSTTTAGTAPATSACSTTTAT